MPQAACADSPSDRDVEEILALGRLRGRLCSAWGCEELDSLSPLRIGPILDDEAFRVRRRYRPLPSLYPHTTVCGLQRLLSLTSLH